MNDLTKLPDDELGSLLLDFKNKLALARESVKEETKSIQAIRAEIDQRAIEAFWANNPGLRLNVGDRLAVTDEFTAFQKEWNPQPWRHPAFIDCFEKSSDGYRVRINDGKKTAGWTTGDIPIDIARRMREAWLRQAGKE